MPDSAYDSFLSYIREHPELAMSAAAPVAGAAIGAASAGKGRRLKGAAIGGAAGLGGVGIYALVRRIQEQQAEKDPSLWSKIKAAGSRVGRLYNEKVQTPLADSLMGSRRLGTDIKEIDQDGQLLSKAQARARAARTGGKPPVPREAYTPALPYEVQTEDEPVVPAAAPAARPYEVQIEDDLPGGLGTAMDDGSDMPDENDPGRQANMAAVMANLAANRQLYTPKEYSPWTKAIGDVRRYTSGGAAPSRAPYTYEQIPVLSPLQRAPDRVGKYTSGAMAQTVVPWSSFPGNARNNQQALLRALRSGSIE